MYRHSCVSWCMAQLPHTAQIRCRGVLFDLDGVLVDSTPAVARAWTKWSIQHGFDPDLVVRTAHGRPSIATIRELLPSADIDAENAQMEHWEITDLDGVVPLPGAVRLIQTLPSERWAIVTSCTRPLAEARIRAACLPLPQHLVTATDIMRGKPDPEPYLKGATFLRLAARNCLVVEDAPAGIRAGKSAGASVMALRTTETDFELSASGADWIVDNLDSLQLNAPADNHYFEFSFRT
jgi:mannitol-1-/sugar-/sorbitol-6-phosphatase